MTPALRRESEPEDLVKALEARVGALEKKIKALKTSLPQEKVIILRAISKEQAKQEILNLFGQGQPLFYSDIAEKLRLDLSTVVEVCEELIAEGKVTTRDNDRG